MNDPKRHLHPRFCAFSPSASASSSSSSSPPFPANHHPTSPLPPLSSASPSPPHGHLGSDQYMNLLKLQALQQQHQQHQQQQQQRQRAFHLRNFPPLSPQESSSLSFSDSSASSPLQSCVQSRNQNPSVQGQTLGNNTQNLGQAQRFVQNEAYLPNRSQNGAIHGQIPGASLLDQNGAILGQNCIIHGQNGAIHGQNGSLINQTLSNCQNGSSMLNQTLSNCQSDSIHSQSLTRSLTSAPNTAIHSLNALNHSLNIPQNGTIHSQNLNHSPNNPQNGGIHSQTLNHNINNALNGAIHSQALSYGQKQQRFPSFFNSSASQRIPMASNTKRTSDVISEIPILRGPTALQSPANGKPDLEKLPQRINGPGKLSPSVDGCREKLAHRMDTDLDRPCEESKRLRLTLQDLERELLGEEIPVASTSIFSDISTSCISQPAKTVSSEAQAERDWTDVIEDLLASDITSYVTTTLDQSTLTSTSNNQSADSGSPTNTSSSPANTSEHSTITTTSSVSPKIPPQAAHPRELLIACANAINTDNDASAESILTTLEQSVSIYGDPIQRLAAYMAKGLRAKMELHRTGHSNMLVKDISPQDFARGSQFLYRYCPYTRVGYMAANGVIADALRNETRIHIVDFNIGFGNQWYALIGSLSQRPGGPPPPHVRITAVGNQSNMFDILRNSLSERAKSLGVPFEFTGLAVDAQSFEPSMIERRPGEALAVNFVFLLNQMPDESVRTDNPRDSLLRKVKQMEPKIVTLVEYNANTNTAPFYPRFMETLNFFNAIFESLHVTVQSQSKDIQKDSKERVNAEQSCLARDIMNIIACEGVDRLKRYEVAGKWKARMSMAGFHCVPLSGFVNKNISDALQYFPPQCKLAEKSGALHLAWMEKDLVSASAWS